LSVGGGRAIFEGIKEELMRDIGHFIGGKQVKGASGRTGDVFNPNTGEVQAKVAFASKSEVEQAIANAQAAFPAWAATNPQRRARVMFKFLELIQAEYDDLARLLSSEPARPSRIPRATSSAGSRWWSSPAASRT
jgi:acyl-CoA reductase-like NAD-dependent aldehyde dehydrogenase